MQLKALAECWSANTANERAAFQTWMLRFLEALGVATPDPPTDDHRFELPIKSIDREGRESTNFIDYWKAGHVAIEAKASEPGRSNDLLLRRAYGQVRSYVASVGTVPPYLAVVDVPKTLIVWDRWSGPFGDFAAGKRVALNTLHERPDDIALLQDIFSRPSARDPRGRAQAVTKEIAGGLAKLAALLEGRGFDQERVARFLMRCVFCCFAEDVGLLPKELFRRTLETARHSGDAARVAKVLTGLWETMDQGGMFGAELLHRFNGHFFKSIEALPLEPVDVDLLIEATTFDWSRVEPSIFGTLLVRALDPVERHRLGAEYTPREYIERLVEPTVVEPIRERWTATQAVVVALTEPGKKSDKKRKDDQASAIKELREFHEWLRGLQFLDPACGSGNFLYVTMAAVKRVELELISELERVTGKEQKEAILDEVHPRQFHGIEIKPWAREIAELTLWIGYHQFWRESHRGRTPPDPILEDTGTIECRDAVLAYDNVVHRPDKDRPDPTPRIVSPVTGELIPDPNAKLKYMEYVNPRPAEWPKADFIVGNPPYMGQARQRDAFGDGYVDALRKSYPLIPDSADLVCYWWTRSAGAIVDGDTLRAGLITTNSITHRQNRTVISAARLAGASVVWAIPDHPWVDDVAGAAVRVAMSVIAKASGRATLLLVNERALVSSVRVGVELNDDLSFDANVPEASRHPVAAALGICSRGFQLIGDGFLLTSAETRDLLTLAPASKQVLRPFQSGRDVAGRSRDLSVIDFGLRPIADAATFVVAFQRVSDRVRPDRIANNDKSTRERWWLFGRNREDLRHAMAGISRYILTPETTKQRFFSFAATSIAPDNTLICIALEDPHFLGILSSSLHVTWATAAGGRLGVGNDPRYNKTRCFDPFPFPASPPATRMSIGTLAERLDTHRKDAIARDERVTMTGMYNVVEKLRSGEALTPKERAIHEIAACGVLKDMHDELDALVAEAYGWPWPMEKEEILERLVKLHDERVVEEKNGQIRWLRPEYQIPRFAPKGAVPGLGIVEAPVAVAGAAVSKRAWPGTAVEQLTAIGLALGAIGQTAAEIAATFDRADGKLIARHLETLALMAEIVDEGGRFVVRRKVA